MNKVIYLLDFVAQKRLEFYKKDLSKRHFYEIYIHYKSPVKETYERDIHGLDCVAKIYRKDYGRLQ